MPPIYIEDGVRSSRTPPLRYLVCVGVYDNTRDFATLKEVRDYLKTVNDGWQIWECINLTKHRHEWTYQHALIEEG